jgi:hypothetical protein
MQKLRNIDFDAVIGIGGIGEEAKANKIAGKINWIGIGPHRWKEPGKNGDVIKFDTFLDYGTNGPDFRQLAPKLAHDSYTRNVRQMKVAPNDGSKYEEACEILLTADKLVAAQRTIVDCQNVKSSKRCKPCIAKRY